MVMNRLGHSETYRLTMKFVIAIFKAMQESSSLHSTETVVNLAAPSLVLFRRPGVHRSMACT